MTDPISEASPSRATNGPGRLLRQAREHAGLSIEDLSAQIKLARGTIDALERDDFRALSEPVYVRGYYRKLAKVLQVSESELLTTYESQVSPKAPPQPSKLILAGGQDLGGSRNINFKLVVGIIIVLLIGLLAVWGSRHEATRPVTAVELPAAVEPGAAPETTTTAPGVESAPADGLPPASTRVPPAPSIAKPAVQAPPRTPSAGLSPPASAAGLAATTSAFGPKPAPLVGQSELQLRFTGTSWTRVEDAMGKPLLSGVIQAGDSQTISGAAPFSIFVGNAPGVQMKFNGQAIDMAKYSKGNNTARFTLP